VRPFCRSGVGGRSDNRRRGLTHAIGGRRHHPDPGRAVRARTRRRRWSGFKSGRSCGSGVRTVGRCGVEGHQRLSSPGPTARMDPARIRTGLGSDRPTGETCTIGPPPTSKDIPVRAQLADVMGARARRLLGPDVVDFRAQEVEGLPARLEPESRGHGPGRTEQTAIKLMGDSRGARRNGDEHLHGRAAVGHQHAALDCRTASNCSRVRRFGNGVGRDRADGAQ